MIHYQHPFNSTLLDGISGNYNVFMPPHDLKLLKSSAKDVCHANKLSVIYYQMFSRQHLNGDGVEFGVWEGRTLHFMSKLFPSKHFWGFDTFLGITGQDLRYDSFTAACHPCREGDFCCQLAQVKENLRDCKNVDLVQCDARSPEFSSRLPNDIFFAHLDMDIYHPTLLACEKVWERLSPGGVIVFDDFGVQGWDGIWKAVYKFCDRQRIDKRRVNVGDRQATLEKW